MNARRLAAALALTFTALGLVIPLHARPRPVQDPHDDDERAERIAYGRLAVENACQMCHGLALVEQQRLTPAQWTAEIEKMVGWGATLAPEEVPDVHAYLAATFGPTNAPAPRTLANLPDVPPAPDAEPEPLTAAASAERGAPLFAEHCAKCHGTDARGGEPGQNLVEHPSLLDLDAFARTVAEGRRRMPAFQDVMSRDQARDVLAWLRTLRFEPPAPR
jgi:mono/diheme cytochrome c family protein